MRIPLVDLKRQYVTIKSEIDVAIQNVINDTSFILGKYTAEFENSFSDYSNTKYCVGLNSGTDALFLSFLAIGLKAGDEVITVANTFFATTEYLGHIGVKPVFCDIDPVSYLIDVNKIENLITSKTKAILPVHLYGQMADMDYIMELAKKYNLAVIEDCAQAHGAEYNGKKAGSIGDIGTYSFYPGKNLGAFGDAGCIVTSNEKYAQFIKKYRDHGRSSKYEHDIEAYSSRMDGLQGSILNTKLTHLDTWIDGRRSVAKLYSELLGDDVQKPVEVDGNKHSYHLYVIGVEKRDDLLQYLKFKEIEAGIHYPIPLHLQSAYRYLNVQQGALPITEKAASRILSLPIYPEMISDEVFYVCNAVNEFIGNL